MEVHLSTRCQLNKTYQNDFLLFSEYTSSDDGFIGRPATVPDESGRPAESGLGPEEHHRFVTAGVQSDGGAFNNAPANRWQSCAYSQRSIRRKTGRRGQYAVAAELMQEDDACVLCL